MVSELESGKLGSLEAARRRYGIGGSTTVQKWLRRFGKAEMLGKVVRVQTPDERDENVKLREENRRLRDVVADLTVEKRVAEGYFRVACDAAGIKDHEAFKKKLATPSLVTPAKPAKAEKP